MPESVDNDFDDAFPPSPVERKLDNIADILNNVGHVLLDIRGELVKLNKTWEDGK